MLADKLSPEQSVGSVAINIHKSQEFLTELLSFIEKQLPIWKSRADRRDVTAETVLTSQLCAHLNSAARLSDGWDVLQFRVEETDEVQTSRKIDLISSPIGCAIIIDGRTYSDFDSLIPIECKRLPTPTDSRRDKREYVISDVSTTGGIQRFKNGNHAAAHNYCAMIGYIQDKDAKYWRDTISDWIDEIIKKSIPGWTTNDHLKLISDNTTLGQSTLESVHTRKDVLEPIQVRHLWISML